MDQKLSWLPLKAVLRCLCLGRGGFTRLDLDETRVEVKGKFELEEGNRALIETFKFIAHGSLLFCIPLLGRFVICDIKNPANPTLLHHNDIDEENSSFQSPSSKMDSETPELAPEAEEKTAPKKGLMSKVFSSLKVAKTKIASTITSKLGSQFSSAKIKEPASMYFDEESQIDDILVLSETMVEDSCVLKLLVVGKFAFDVNKIFLEIVISGKEWCVTSSSIVNFVNSDLISFSKSKSLKFYTLTHKKHLTEGKMKVLEATQNSASVYEIDLQTHEVSFQYQIDYPSDARSQRLFALSQGLNLLTHDGSHLYSVSTLTMTGREVYRSPSDKSSMTINDNRSIVLMSCFDSIDIVDLNAKLCAAVVDLYCLETKTV